MKNVNALFIFASLCLLVGQRSYGSFSNVRQNVNSELFQREERARQLMEWLCFESNRKLKRSINTYNQSPTRNLILNHLPIIKLIEEQSKKITEDKINLYVAFYEPHDIDPNRAFKVLGDLPLKPMKSYFKLDSTPTFNQAWQKCTKNSDKIAVIEAALDGIAQIESKAVANEQIAALRDLIAQQAFLGYIQVDLLNKADQIIKS